jgi:hypothetical protein
VPALFITALVALWVAIALGIIGSYSPLSWDGWTGFRANGKLWDWIQLLSAPIFISAIPFVFGFRRAAPEREPGQQPALEAYEDYILELLLNKDLRASPPDSCARETARARTLSVLHRIGIDRKREVLEFLHENELISKRNTVIDLHNADLREADLKDANLIDANLRAVDLRRARLSRANLSGADLSYVNLIGADITGVNLSGANLEGAIHASESSFKARR